jgi:hypothetical protein
VGVNSASGRSEADGARIVARAVRVLGSRAAVADLLGVRRAEVGAWVDGTGAPSASTLRRLAAVTEVVEHVAVAGEHGRRWLHRPSPALDGALPLDVALVDGPARVLDAFADERPR